MADMYDVAVIGSGFGGSVAALRAAQAGKRVVVLEQGRRLSPADLQAGAAKPMALLWEPALGLRGYFRQKVLRHVMVVGGVGVGGGSIVYAAVLLKPSEFSGAWTRTGVDWATELAPHYERAALMLGREVNPQWGVQDDWLQAASQQLGAGDTFGKTPQGIRFADCVACGQCITGCPHGAKEFRYLPEAEALGAEVRPVTKAEILVPLADGWRVVTRNPFSGAVSSVEAPRGRAGSGGPRNRRVVAGLPRQVGDVAGPACQPGAQGPHQLRGVRGDPAPSGHGCHRRRNDFERLLPGSEDPCHQQPVPRLLRLHALLLGAGARRGSLPATRNSYVVAA